MFNIVVGIASILSFLVSGWTLRKVSQIKEGYDFIVHAERAERKLSDIEDVFLNAPFNSGNIPIKQVEAELRKGITVIKNVAAEAPPGDNTTLVKMANDLSAVLDRKNKGVNDYYDAYDRVNKAKETLEHLSQTQKLGV